MIALGGIVDSYAYYVPTNPDRNPPVPSTSLIPLGDGDWCVVDERTYEGPTWSPSVCISDGPVIAEDVDGVRAVLLERHEFAWPERIRGWTLSSVRREVVVDEDDIQQEGEN